MSSDTKKWYESKGVWLGIIQFLSGALAVVYEYTLTGDFGLPATILLASGILAVVVRVYFTNTAIV